MALGAASPQSAFIVPVPQAEPCVGRLRDRFDPSARRGAPAHVTILYPFMPPGLIGDEVLREVHAFSSGIRAFGFTLTRIDRFPGVLYLAPDPAGPFVDLTMGLARLFPGYPPHGGRHDSVVPHLTVAQAADDQLDAIETQLRAAVPEEGIDAHCPEFVLIENTSGRWRRYHSFALAA